MIKYKRCATDKVDYSGLYELLKNDQTILSYIDSRKRIKEVIISAALFHFSALPPKEQFRALAEYLKKG
jgi:hypothetical protein